MYCAQIQYWCCNNNVLCYFDVCVYLMFYPSTVIFPPSLRISNIFYYVVLLMVYYCSILTSYYFKSLKKIPTSKQKLTSYLDKKRILHDYLIYSKKCFLNYRYKAVILLQNNYGSFYNFFKAICLKTAVEKFFVFFLL